MSNFGQGGWITRVMSLQNQALATAGEAYTQKEVRKAEKKRSAAQRAHEATIADRNREFKEKELLSKMSVSQRRDILFKQIAIYSIISIGMIAILITGGVFLVKSKSSKREKVA